ncbi:MAG: hypothetical protein ACYC3I_11735 [Gemmataceae bacterium]
MIRVTSLISWPPRYFVRVHGCWRVLVVVLLLSGCNQTESFLRPTAATPGTPNATPVATQPDDAIDAGANPEPSTQQGEGALPAPRVEEAPSNAAIPPAEAWQTAPPTPLPPGSVASDPVSSIWGIAGLRVFPYGQTMASNGNEFEQLFSLDLNFNIWLWRAKRLYAYSDSRFWGQKAAPGITNPTQGAFDFSKREFDFTGGAAWNYYGNWEFRAFAYSFNNLNRGNSLTSPQGFNDGVGVENRYYLNSTYAALGTPAFDKARATFLSIGYYPSKSMVDGKGVEFKPGAFARAYLIWEIYGPKLYLFTDDTFLTDKSFQPALFNTDSGIAYRPFDRVPRLEFRLGTADTVDLLNVDVETSAYVSLRYIF